MSEWEDVPLPTGIQPLPDWLKGLHIDFMMDCGNAPQITLKVKGDVWEWPGQTWALEEKGNYRARHKDGRVQQLNHQGGVKPMTVWRLFCNDRPVEYKWMIAKEPGFEAAQVEAFAKLEKMLAGRADHDYEFKIFGTVMCRANTRVVLKVCDVTTEDYGGFGGAQYLLQMTDGSRERILRGPWSGGTPPGCVVVSTWDTESPYRDFLGSRPWHKRGGRGGQHISEDLFLRAVARFAPHLRVARVEGWGLQPYLVEWGMPKQQWQEQQP